MWSFNLVRWLRTRSRARSKTIEKKPRFRLCVEELETRLAPATFIWTGAASSNWGVAGNWQGNAAPTAGSTVDALVFNNLGAGRQIGRAHV